MQENVPSYLEIGSFSGAAIRLVSTVLPKGARIVAVDKPWKSTKLLQLQQVVKELRQGGYDVRHIIGDSADAKIIAAAKALGPFDAVFIDGDHTLAYVKSDWINYGSVGRLVGFHDVARDLPKNEHGGPHQVATFWNEIKVGRRHLEFISAKTRARTDGKAAYGIGVVFN